MNDVEVESQHSETDPLLDIQIDDVSNPGTMQFDGKKYAVGLIWLAASDIDSQDTLYKKAKSIGADFYCSRMFVQQQGYGRIKSGHRMGMTSMAALVADALVGEWHGVFKGDNGWLYVAVHADNIAPDGDIFFEIEEEAYNYFMSQSKKYKWPKTYAPENWNIKANDGEISFDQVVDTTQLVKLKPVNLDAFFGGKANKSLAILVLLVGIGLLFLTLMSQSLVQSFLPERTESPRQNISLSESLSVPPQKAEAAADPVQALIDKTDIPIPQKILVSCVENFDDLMVSIPGWNIDRMRCRGNFVEAVWRRGVGDLRILQNNLDELPFGVSKTFGSSGNFVASRVVSLGIDDTNKLRLARREQALILLNNRFSGLGSLQVRDIAPQQNNRRQGRRGRNTEIEEPLELTLQDIPSLSAVFKTEMSPSVTKQNFNIPGLKLNMLEWDIDSGLWSYDMQIYLFPENYVTN